MPIDTRDPSKFRVSVTKEFVLPNVKNSTDLPNCVHEACIAGTHAPVNPHRQRLLVAANKAAKVKATPAAKSKAKASDTHQVTDPQAKPNQKATLKGTSSEKPSTSETPYILVKKQFLATLLGCFITTMHNCFLPTQHVMLRPIYNILLISPGWIHLWHTVTESAGGKSQVIFQTGKQVQRASKCGFP